MLFHKVLLYGLYIQQQSVFCSYFKIMKKKMVVYSNHSKDRVKKDVNHRFCGVADMLDKLQNYNLIMN